MDGGWGSFDINPTVGKSSIDWLLVRCPIPEDPIEAQQLSLFKYGEYAYHVLVTNLKTHPWRVRKFYAKRATVEKNVRELLYDYPLGEIPTDDWVANVAFFSDSSLRLQHRPLVQATLLTQRVSLQDFGNYSNRLSCLASQVNQSQRPKRAQVAPRLPLPGTIRECSSENFTTSVTLKFMNFQMHNFLRCSIFKDF